jgi:hypothetical protein
MIETRPQKPVAGGVDPGGHEARQHLNPVAVIARGYSSRPR